MIQTSKILFRIPLFLGVCTAAMMWNGAIPLQSSSSLLSSAEARIGRPLTPMSYAGVARRTTRRAVVGTAAVYGGAVVASPVCTQAVDVYGRIVTVCR
jgi:hypothetical protein